ncbi:MAG: NifU family protein [Tenericutes bacterium]|nr:NifU family protein [Mycoplasmatota bacterium]
MQNEKIKNIIEKITPYLNSDGGNIELVKVEDNVVYVKLTGACGCCPHRNETIKYGILESIQSECPEITDVINVDI